LSTWAAAQAGVEYSGGGAREWKERRAAAYRGGAAGERLDREMGKSVHPYRWTSLVFSSKKLSKNDSTG
jgi:hypothetical protein